MVRSFQPKGCIRGVMIWLYSHFLALSGPGGGEERGCEGRQEQAAGGWAGPRPSQAGSSGTAQVSSPLRRGPRAPGVSLRTGVMVSVRSEFVALVLDGGVACGGSSSPCSGIAAVTPRPWGARASRLWASLSRAFCLHSSPCFIGQPRARKTFGENRRGLGAVGTKKFQARRVRTPPDSHVDRAQPTCQRPTGTHTPGKHSAKTTILVKRQACVKGIPATSTLRRHRASKA